MSGDRLDINRMDMETIKELYREKRHAEMLTAILEQARLTSDYNRYLSLCRWRQRLASEMDSPDYARVLRIAILGGATTDFLEQPLRLELETLGLGCTLHSSNYNTYVPEMLDAASDSAAFRPDLAVFLTTPYNIADWPAVGDSQDSVQALVDRVCDHWLDLCQSFHAHTNCEIILNNQHLLPARVTGNLGSQLPWDQNNYLRRINAALGLRAPAYVHILDIDTLSSIHGVSKWFDPRFWHHSKQPVSFDCIVPLVRNLASIIGALYGRTAKCLVLDLDNTLWGGVVGDDGVEGLRIGEGDAEGEAFKAFQEYLLQLKRRGLLLAVCSKNEPENALAPFAQLPDMVLRRDDFVVFRANWDPKSEGLVEIAKQLNIGLDALVFVDDNPAERALVRQVLPEVKVVELSADPAEFPQLLDQSGWLELASLTDEDREKTEQYRRNMQRSEMQVQHSDYDSYLESLDQKAIIGEFAPQQLDRITQLINKTNQFNLTTQRLNRSEVEALMEDPDTLTACVRLADRFGDNGLISVLVGHREEAVLHVDLWLMSCRVFKRGVEYMLANHLFEKAFEMGVKSVIGTYRPTEKNRIVANLYADLGFEKCAAGEDGTSRWQLELKDYRPVPVSISLVEDFRA